MRGHAAATSPFALVAVQGGADYYDVKDDWIDDSDLIAEIELVSHSKHTTSLPGGVSLYDDDDEGGGSGGGSDAPAVLPPTAGGGADSVVTGGGSGAAGAAATAAAAQSTREAWEAFRAVTSDQLVDLA